MDVHEGDRLRVAVDGYAVAVLTTWAAPFTGGGEKRPLPRDTVVVVDAVVEGRPAFVAMAEEYKAMERVLVDDDVRRAPRYSGYYLVVPRADVGTSLVPA